MGVRLLFCLDWGWNWDRWYRRYGMVDTPTRLCVSATISSPLT